MRNCYSILLLLFMTSCSGDECGNSLDVYGTYVNYYRPDDVNYITLKKDGTYYYFYKKKNQKEKVFEGKWKLSSIKNECQVLFYEWKDIVGYMKIDELSANYAHHRNDKLMFFEDIQGAEYEKKGE